MTVHTAVHTPVVRGRGIIGQLPILWGRTDRARQWAHTVEQARREAADRRARVLAHKDIAARLVTELGYRRPEQWSGFIPPSTTDTGKANTSARRRALIDILRAVVEAEQVAEVAA